MRPCSGPRALCACTGAELAGVTTPSRCLPAPHGDAILIEMGA